VAISALARAAPDRRFLVVASIIGALALALVSVAVDALAIRGFFGPPGDALWVTPFRVDAQAILDGRLPYHDFPLEYPPLSLVTFVLPAIVGGLDPEAYRIAFEALMVGCGMALVPIVAVTVARLGGRRSDVAWAIVLVAATPVILGPIVLSRYDLWPTLLAAAAVAALLYDRHRLAYVVLALAVLAKAYPVVLAPLFVTWTWRRAGTAELVRASAIGIAIGLAVLLPFVWLDPDGALAPFTRTVARPLQVESLGASILIGLHNVVGIDPGLVDLTFGSHNLLGDLPTQVSVVQSLALLAALVAMWLAAVARPITPGRLVVGCAATLAVSVALGKVLSTQYPIWLLPAVAVLPPILGWRPLAGLALLLGLTNLEYPSLYRGYVERFDPLATAVVLVRNIGLVLLAAHLAALFWARRPSDRAT
jgi:hypothetical protein